MSDESHSQGANNKRKTYGASAAVFATAILLFGAAWLLWVTDDMRAQGAAITLVGVAASHLVKEVQELIKSWLENR